MDTAAGENNRNLHLGNAAIPKARIDPVGQIPTPRKFVYFMWAIIWFDPDWFLASHGASTLFVKLYALMYLPVLAILVSRWRNEAFFGPFLAVLAIHCIWVPFASNRGLAINVTQKVLSYCLLYSLTISVVDSPRQMVPLLKLFLFQFLWYGLQGIRAGGKVEWHVNLNNEDSFGPFMTMGMAFSYYFMLGAYEKKYKRWGGVISLLGMAGTVVSFARGAMISMCIVFGAIFLRTPRKMHFISFGVIAALLGLVVIQVAFPNGEFWDEMGTITSEGTSAGTGFQRWVLWGLAVEMFESSPILGVGPGNFGWAAAEYYLSIGARNLGDKFDDPSKLFMFTLHNDYITILTEQGILGLIAFFATLLYFWKAIKYLQTEAVRKVWQEHTGGFIESRSLALGLRAAMVAFLANSIFYNQYYCNWFWSLVMLALVAANVTRRVLLPVEQKPPPLRNFVEGVVRQ